MSLIDRLQRVFFWLSGASTETLESCPSWERRKYVAFGATVLVPSTFALIASAYAVGTLTDHWFFIIPVSLVWSFIILTVDRALLATYRAYQNIFRKAAQFGLRIIVAALMGMTISHPMTLLLFRDTINSEIEKDRQAEIEVARAKGVEQKLIIETKVKAAETEIAMARERWNDTFSANFLDGGEKGKVEISMTDEEKQKQTALEAQIAEATKTQREQLATMDKQIAGQEAANVKLGGELNFWQTEFEREVNGQRSGILGVGPRAKSIQDDQLAWRRLEAKRLAGILEAQSMQRKQLSADIDAVVSLTTSNFNAKIAEQTARLKADQDRVDSLKKQVQQQQADQFVTQQNGIRDTLQKQLDAQLVQLKGLHEGINRLGADEEARVQSIKDEPRRDILTQTLALHHLFDKGNEGGQFALIAYIVLTALFMLVDTIPLVMKFFSKAGPYDSLVDLDEMKFDSNRKLFVSSMKQQMKGMAKEPHLHFGRNQPLSAALIEGVDRSRAAKEFMEHLLSLEKAFEEKVRIERELIAAEKASDRAAERIRMLEEMVQRFYTDLRQRMETFFGADAVKRAV